MKHKFKVGDKVQFKSWEELKEEFGVTVLGDIPTSPYYFTAQMKHLCNTQAIIREVLNDREVMLDGFDVAYGNGGVFAYCTDMLKPVKEKKKQKKDLASEDLEDCVEYSLKKYKQYLKDMENRKISNGYKLAVVDGIVWTIDKKIEYHEKRLAELKAQKQKEKWVFTEDEKVILRNLPKEYKYIVRESKEGGEGLTLFPEKPTKGYYNWGGKNWHCIREFNHIFQCIQWSDEEPCEFRKFI